jgi:hypothetical protein
MNNEQRRKVGGVVVWAAFVIPRWRGCRNGGGGWPVHPARNIATTIHTGCSPRGFSLHTCPPGVRSLHDLPPGYRYYSSTGKTAPFTVHRWPATRWAVMFVVNGKFLVYLQKIIKERKKHAHIILFPWIKVQFLF